MPAINKKLNLVIPVEVGGKEAFVHATPISMDTFERYYLPLSKTFARIHTQGLSWVQGPRVAALMLEEVAREDGSWDGPEGVRLGLVAEIMRLSNVLILNEKGWQLVPLQQAIDSDLLDREDASGVRNAVTFFTVASWGYPKKDFPGVMAQAARIWGGRIESLDSTALAASLKTSTEVVSSGEKSPPAVSSHPS
jgi:hypothetical protein